ncbi:hypothetical protein [Laspinema olomoucense]|uniref:hypothetical protein n=1 Tax=Laspinema olomoucense TaxID=3231600 RepID=UPI0021BA8472|nr:MULTISPECIES: hypothetical protein [unclassified Laspinema]MCT7975582.1 hypothetical protein [Laspinema sp. D3d]MCT7991541.1 hypothetical protein [Laspinema sp. D3a]MCT7996901.1 hypothetical protein [Laspinema sp. D3c]
MTICPGKWHNALGEPQPLFLVQKPLAIALVSPGWIRQTLSFFPGPPTAWVKTLDPVGGRRIK